jgi:hypothetical protein
MAMGRNPDDAQCAGRGLSGSSAGLYESAITMWLTAKAAPQASASI